MRLLPVLMIVFAAPALSAPRVATDIAPVHSIASQVMDGVGEPALLLPAGASPHGYAMRPSEARALEDAEIIFWVGEALTPWLKRGIENLAPEAEVVDLLGADGSRVLPSRDRAIFEHGDHGHDHAHKDDDHHDDKHDDHAIDGDGHDDHDHGRIDPHAWLDPKNAEAWVDQIAATLAKADPANAGAYATNAAAAKARIASDTAAISARLDTVRGRKFVVFHDAYQYFEARFEMPSAGAISIGDARKPSPARLAEIRDHVRKNDVVCVFAEPQFNAGVVNAVAEGANVRSGVMDPLGVAHAPGPAFYGAMLQDLAASMIDCLAD